MFWTTRMLRQGICTTFMERCSISWMMLRRTRFSLGQPSVLSLNILGDPEIDKTNFREMYRAALNILEDENAEAAHLRDAQGAMLNILDDSELDKLQLQEMHRAALNILDDFDFDKSELRAVQRASLNILEDARSSRLRKFVFRRGR